VQAAQRPEAGRGAAVLPPTDPQPAGHGGSGLGKEQAGRNTPDRDHTID
jgi:hypothetical protein